MLKTYVENTHNHFVKFENSNHSLRNLLLVLLVHRLAISLTGPSDA